MNKIAAFTIVVLFASCCSQVVLFEFVVKEDPGAGNLLTFVQFLFVALVGFCTVGKFGTAKRIIPFRKYLGLVGFFWTTSVLNNYAFNFNISMPLHMIFRAGTLIANMAMGIWILKRRYPLQKYLAVLMISVGIAVCTIQSSKAVKVSREAHENAAEEERLQYVDWLWWCLGVAILTVALFLSARMGIFQEALFVKHGKHPWEALYYTHMLPLMFWLPTYPNLINHFNIALETAPVEILGVPVPKLIIDMILFMTTQGICISAVYVLVTECTSLTVTLTVTLRKFISLVFSIYYFRNPFTIGHWIGTLLVFVGTLIFTEVIQKIIALFRTLGKDESKQNDVGPNDVNCPRYKDGLKKYDIEVTRF